MSARLRLGQAILPLSARRVQPQEIEHDGAGEEDGAGEGGELERALAAAELEVQRRDEEEKAREAEPHAWLTNGTGRCFPSPPINVAI